MAAKQSKRQFKAEISQLLEIITHSIYTNREIFLRELISNASDALDKLRFVINSGTERIEPEAELAIRIECDTEANTITVVDSGIGMTREELVDNIGTIAHSGSAAFMKQAAESGQSADAIIGRFGVGFYSVFMVAEKVAISTRAAVGDAMPVLWTSTGAGSYTLEDLPAEASSEQASLPRGTSIHIQLKEDCKEFADKTKLQNIIREHSSFISFPILVDGERVNTTPALWREPKFQIEKKQYNEFYTFLTYDNKEPLETLHLAVDAPVQFTGLLFIPDTSSASFFDDPDNYGLDLYVRRVLIDRKHNDLIPQYMGFVRGLVDTEDLPLNISRETLQENLLTGKIRSTVTKQLLSCLDKLSADKQRYSNFWNHHGRTFKLGYSDIANREKFAELLRFNSSADAEAADLSSLADYVSRMKENQKEIYYLSGPGREAIRLNPHLELLKRKGIEVLYLYETIDEFILDSLGTYKEYSFVSADQAQAETLEQFTDQTDTVQVEELSGEDSNTFEDMLKAAQEVLGERVKEVRTSKRLKDSPACLVNPDDGMTSQMQKIMQAMNKDSIPPVKVLELNRDHPLLRNLLKVFRADRTDAFFSTCVEQLFESALLLDGYLTDPHALVNRVNLLLEQSSGWYAEIKKL